VKEELFPIRLKQLRTERKLTLEDLAKSIGTTKTTLSRYENGERSPKLQILGLLANFFDVDMAWLAGSEEDIKKEESNLSVLGDIFGKLNNDNQNEVIHFARYKLDEQELEKSENDKNEEFMRDLSAFIDEFGQDAYEDLYNFIVNKRKKNDDNADAV